MRGFDLLGADGLAGKYITLRVKQIDTAKLKKALGGSAGAAAPLALALADWQPEFALNTALPVVIRKARDEYGVELEYTLTNVPPPPGQAPKSDFGKGALAGAALVGSGWAAWRFLISKYLL